MPYFYLDSYDSLSGAKFNGFYLRSDVTAYGAVRVYSQYAYSDKMVFVYRQNSQVYRISVYPKSLYHLQFQGTDSSISIVMSSSADQAPPRIYGDHAYYIREGTSNAQHLLCKWGPFDGTPSETILGTYTTAAGFDGYIESDKNGNMYYSICTQGSSASGDTVIYDLYKLDTSTDSITQLQSGETYTATTSGDWEGLGVDDTYIFVIFSSDVKRYLVSDGSYDSIVYVLTSGKSYTLDDRIIWGNSHFAYGRTFGRSILDLSTMRSYEIQDVEGIADVVGIIDDLVLVNSGLIFQLGADRTLNAADSLDAKFINHTPSVDPTAYPFSPPTPLTSSDLTNGFRRGFGAAIELDFYTNWS